MAVSVVVIVPPSDPLPFTATATGASFTGPTVMVAVAMLDSKLSGEPPSIAL